MAQRTVYIVTTGEYSDRMVDAIFTTRELAEEWVERCHRQNWEIERRRMNSSDPVVRRFMASPYEGWTYEQYKARDDGNVCGYIDEHDLWDVLPINDDPSPQD